MDEICEQYTEIKNFFEEFKNNFVNNTASSYVNAIDSLDLKLPFCDTKSLFESEKSMMNDGVYYSQMVLLILFCLNSSF